MRKSILLISLLFLALIAKAAVINITPTSPHSSDNLRQALNSASDGDIIEMATGTYVESNTNYIAFTGKSITVRPEENANVVIKPHVPFTISGGARAEIKNVKIDASELCSLASYSHLMYPSDGADNNRLILNGCEIYGYTEGKAIIASRSSYKLDSLIINNCKFYNHTTRSCVFLENTANKGLIVTNSTFYNIATGTESFGAGIIDDRSTTAKVRVDHCTFYNVIAQSTSYAAIGQIKTTDAIVSNCIFALSAPGASTNRTIRDHVAANNCLVYNYTTDSNYGMQSDVTKTNCNIGNPLFTDAANGDFSFAGNWVTGSISPAREAGTDGSDLGDPRWYTEETIPSTNFAADYNCSGVLALAVDQMEHDASNYIKSKAAGGSAIWKIYATRGCLVQVTLNLLESYALGHNYKVEIFDAEGNSKGSLIEGWHTSRGDSLLSGAIQLPKPDVYKVVLTNEASGSTTTIKGITLSYYGGAIQAVSPSANTTLNVADALFTSGATRAEGQISYSSWNTADSWIKWNIATSETKFYDLTLNFSSDNAHSMAVNIYEDEEASPVATVSESWTDTHGILTLSDRINLVGGKNYIVKVTNPTGGSHAKVTSVLFAPVVASATALPNTLAFSNAVLSEKAHITNDMLYFNEIGDKDPVGQWAQWEVTTDHNGLFLFTMNVTSENEQTYKITILDNSENVRDFYETSPGSGAKEIKHYFALATGTYFVKVENTRSYSKGHLVSFAVTEPAGIVTLDENATSNSEWLEKVGEETTYDVQIIRTIKAGMYNTFCLPFEVSSSQCKDIFGSDVQIRTLEEATIEDDFVLNLNFKTASDIYPGTPVLIQTSRDIANPVFTGVQFTIAAPSATTKTNANYAGTFVKSTLSADENILFLGANNKLFFPTAEIDILGMRGWFVVHGSGGASAPAIRSARIVENNQVATDIELVNGKCQNGKFIKDGHLYILRGDELFNAQGARVQ